MNRIDNKGVTYLTFDKLTALDCVRHGFSTKVGGVSRDEFESMNLGFNRGDSDENVRDNFKLIADAMGMDHKAMCLSHQTHTTNVRVMTKEDAGNGIVRPLPYSDVDGMVTNVEGMPLVTFYADCVPLYFVDPVKRVIGLSHSGWRGTVGKIGKVTVETMTREFGCEPSDIVACIGPSICRDCYEVSRDVVEAFETAFGYEVTHERLVKSSLYHPDVHDKYMLDLWEANRFVFLEAGIKLENIETTDVCTRCNHEWMYSHRVMGTKRGSLAAFLELK